MININDIKKYHNKPLQIYYNKNTTIKYQAILIKNTNGFFIITLLKEDSNHLFQQVFLSNLSLRSWLKNIKSFQILNEPINKILSHGVIRYVFTKDVD